MSHYYRTILTGKRMLLDAYPNAFMAHSLRLISSSYNGPCIRALRTSDNAELDIGFVGGVLDVATLLSFAGSGTVNVRAIYDQTGNNRNFSQANITLQPRIVVGGVLNTLNGKPAILFNGTNSYLFTGNLSSGVVSKVFSTTVSSCATTNATRLVFAHLGNLSFRSLAAAYYQSTGRLAAQFSTTNTTFQTNVFQLYSANTQYLHCTIWDTTNANSQLRVSVYQNGVLEFNSTSTPQNGNIFNNTQPFSLGADRLGNFVLSGSIQEAIYWNSDQDSNLLGIQANVNNFYGAY